MEPTTTLIGKYAPDFELPGTDHGVHHLARYLETFQAVGVIFICNHCPFVRLYLDRFKQLQTQFQDQGFTLIGINANDATRYPEDGFEEMIQFSTDHQLNFPYLRDVTQDVAHSFRASATPQAFLIDRKSVVRYSGGIDDSPQDPGAVQTPYLELAITQLLAYQEVAQAETEAVGCSIKWRS
ncbi:MAG: thioredoxin family protein [Leptolyngbyaceae cyanobacterium bins.59]|nr:thioredoxin family protein [Leptolyngbyaceae cyanobacterium bins.59]